MTDPFESRETCSTRLAWLNRFRDTVVDLLFPPRCVACHRVGAWLCSNCMAGAQIIQPPICGRCGLPLGASGPSHTCRLVAPLDRLLACAFHSGPIREAIHEFKYQDLRALAVPLGRLMAQGWIQLAGSCDPPEILVPVPLHAARQQQRGYNQSALLARELAKALQRPLVENLLTRAKATRPQVDLDFLQRRANVLDAFRCPAGAFDGTSVLLVDDVCTTGSTLAAASEALKAAGASSVLAYTLARAQAPS